MDLNYLIKRAQKGDEDAFGRLKQIFLPETVCLAARFLLDGEEAEDVAEAVFEDVSGKLGRLKDPELFERWLYWCTARECRERLRERVPALFTEKDVRGEKDPAAGLPQKGERIPPKKRELIEKIVDAVDGLPVLQRFPFVYSRLCGYSIEETAAFMGLDERTVFFRVRSGEAALYESLREAGLIRRAGLEDIALALRDYPLRYLRPREEEWEELAPEKTPVRKARPAAEEEPPPLDLFEEEEDDLPEEDDIPEEEEEDRRSSVLPILILVCSLIFAALVFFIVWTLKDGRAKKDPGPTEASFSVQAPTVEPGRTQVTAIPKAAVTAAPTATPVPTPTPGPTAVPPDTAGLEYLPEANEWFPTVCRAVACVQGTMNVRRGPDTKYPDLGTLSAGQEVLVYGTKDSWYLVEYTEGKLGWASGKYVLGLFMFTDRTNENLSGITPPSGEIPGAEVKKIGAFEGAKLYRDPSEKSTYTKNVSFGTKVCVLSFEGDWVFVNEAGNFGWMKKEAFDTADAMDVDNGTYWYTVAGNAVIEDTGKLVKVEAKLKKQEYITQANLEKFLSGETAKTKNGTKLKPDFTGYQISEAEAAPGVPLEYRLKGEETRFVYDEGKKLYALYSGSAPVLYSYKKLTLMIRPDAVIKDMRFCPVYGTGVPSYGTENADGWFVTDGSRLDDYVGYVRSKNAYDGLSGTVTIQSGAVMELTIEYEE